MSLVDGNQMQDGVPRKATLWHLLSHRDRYRRMNTVRRIWCRRYRQRDDLDRRDRVVHLDGRWINDISGFYLALGEAVNGPYGYFGGCLNALSDCLCSSFGVLPPLTVKLSHFEQVRKALDHRAWAKWRAEGFREAVEEGASTELLVSWGYFEDDSAADIEKWNTLYKAALADESFDHSDFGSYFDLLIEVFESHGAKLVPDDEETN